MTDKQKLLAAKLLRLASDDFSNHGCNELDSDTFDGWTDAEKADLLFELRSCNNDPEIEVEYVGDSGLMDFFAWKLECEAKGSSR